MENCSGSPRTTRGYPDQPTVEPWEKREKMKNSKNTASRLVSQVERKLGAVRARCRVAEAALRHKDGASLWVKYTQAQDSELRAPSPVSSSRRRVGRTRSGVAGSTRNHPARTLPPPRRPSGRPPLLGQEGKEWSIVAGDNNPLAFIYESAVNKVKTPAPIPM